MAFTNEEKTEIKDLVIAAMEERMERRRMAAPPEPPPPQEIRKLYLLSFSGNALGLPWLGEDRLGRVVLSSACYAYVTVLKEQRERKSMYGSDMRVSMEDVEIVADQDGRRYKQPFVATIFGGSVVSMVEVKEELLK